MSNKKLQARHVFQGGVDDDSVEMWRNATGEPCFVWGVGGGLKTLMAVQSAFGDWLKNPNTSADLTLYHNGAGADFLSAWDPAPHKILMLDRWPSRWERYLDWHLRYTGRVAVSNESLLEVVKSRFQWIPDRYLHVFPTPSVSTVTVPVVDRVERTVIRLSEEGWRRYKGRLKALSTGWNESGYSLLILLPSGAKMNWTNGTVEARSGVALSDAWRTALCCDSVLVLNDFELDTLWVKSLLKSGLFPLFPEGESPARTGGWLEAGAPEGYSWGDSLSALERLKAWRERAASETRTYATWVESTFSDLTDNEFQSAWQGFKDRLSEQRAPKLREWKAKRLWTPLPLYKRIDRLRRGD